MSVRPERAAALAQVPLLERSLPPPPPVADDGCSCGSFTPQKMAAAVPRRKWRDLPGRNRYCCDGRVLMSRHTGVFYFTVGLIVGTMALFFAFDGRYLAAKLSPLVPIIAAALLLLSLANLFRTSFSDPGILPRATAAEAADIERQITMDAEPGSAAPQYRPPPRTRQVVINGQPVKLKYCFTCKLFRPPRSSHCSVCDNCIMNFDHHCPWVGNCVGRRNYRYFYFFIVTLSLLCVYVFACVVVHMVLLSREHDSFLLAVQQSPGSLIVLLICFFSVWSVLGLAGFHTYLLTSNQTTNEDIKGTFSPKRQADSKNPYASGGLLASCCRTVCASESPSLIDRRGFVASELTVVVTAPSRPAVSSADVSAYGSA